MLLDWGLSMLNTFRIVSLLEGCSFLLLLFVAMPAKYYLGYPQGVSLMGWVHGFLFMAYMYYAMAVAQRQNWSSGFSGLVMLAGFLPFACFVLERRLKKEVELVPEVSTSS